MFNVRNLVGILLTLTLVLPLSANAWVTADNVTIKSLVQFESGISRDYTIVEFSNGAMCRIPHSTTDKELYSFALALYMAGKKVWFHCHNTASDPGASGYNTHLLHRLVAK